MSENKLYNPEIKEKYLSKFESEETQTQNTIRHILRKAYIMEESRQRDLYDFNIEEVGNVIKNYVNPRNKTVAKSTIRFISSYISYCCDIGLRENGINPLDEMTKDEEWVSSLVDMTKKIHYSDDEFLNLVRQLENEQDKAMLTLMFEGIIGQSFSQLTVIKYDDIDWKNNKVYVEERNESIEVNKDCIEFIELAFKETSYKTYNEKENRYSERDLLPSTYLFKNLKTPRANEGDPVKQNVLYSRLTQIRNEFHLDYLTPNSIKQSGMLKMAAELFDENGKLEYGEFEKIGDKYGLSKIFSNEYYYYNTTMMKQFISSENLKELYNIDIKF
jgi:integrase